MKALVISPHLDDETLGCGGTLLRHKREGDAVAWLNVSGISMELGFSAEKVNQQTVEIERVAQLYNFDAVHNLNLPPAQLDMLPSQQLVERLGEVIRLIRPDVIYLPFPGDIHTDHRIVFDAAIACTKWFRGNTIKRVLVYETLSETDFGLSFSNGGFKPNVYVNITEFLETKITIMRLYEKEMGIFPYPRSDQAIRALAQVRGVVAGYAAAEGFILLREII
jgi:LmbE family N-acetylglucosaminyl deacetylase